MYVPGYERVKARVKAQVKVQIEPPKTKLVKSKQTHQGKKKKKVDPMKLDVRKKREKKEKKMVVKNFNSLSPSSTS